MAKERKTLGTVSSELIIKLIEKSKDIFTLHNACEIYGKGRQETSDLLGDLVNRGVLVRIKSGVFLILKVGQEATQLSNWPLIARALVTRNEPRDVFDIWFLLQKIDKFDFHREQVCSAFKEKYGFNINAGTLKRTLINNSSLRNNWDKRLSRQVAELPDFDMVIKNITNKLDTLFLSTDSN